MHLVTLFLIAQTLKFIFYLLRQQATFNLDAGIIQCFKGHYRRQHLRHLVDCIDNNEPPLLSLKDAVRYTKRAWDSVSQDTIVNCWIHSGLVQRNETNLVSVANTDRNLTNDDEHLLHRVYDDLEVDPDLQMTVSEFINVDKDLQTSQDVSDENIIQSVIVDTSEESSTYDDDDAEVDVQHTC